MKKLLIILMCIVMILSSCVYHSDSEDTSVSDTESTDIIEDTVSTKNNNTEGERETDMAPEISFMTAKVAVESINFGFNFGNNLDTTGDWIKTTDPYEYERCWGEANITKEAMQFLKEQGFNAVRIPITWNYHMTEDGEIFKPWMKRVAEVVDYAMELDLYVLINAHHDGGDGGWVAANEESYTKYSERFANMWREIAERFSDYGEKLMFGSTNEVLDGKGNWSTNDPETHKWLNKYNQLFVDTVRKTGGNNAERNLVVMTYAGSCGTDVLNGFTLPTDTVEDHLIVEVHNYAPMDFCWQEIGWGDVRDTWGTERDYEELEEWTARVEKYSKKFGAPFIVGEFGASFKGTNDYRIEYVTAYIKTAKKHGIKCFWWNCGDMSVLDKKEAAWQHPDVAKAMLDAANN